MHVRVMERICALGVLMAVGCGGIAEESGTGDDPETKGQRLEAEPDDPCQRTFAIELPPGFAADEVAIGATESLFLNDRVRLTAVAGQPLAPAANLGSGELDVGVDASTGELFAEGAVRLHDRASVQGAITTEGVLTRGNGTTVSGTITERASLTTDLAAWQVCFPSANSGNVQLEPDQIRVLAPGDYGALSVKSRARLALRSGHYTFSSIMIEPQARLVLDTSSGPIELYSREGFTFRGVLEQAAGDAADLLVGVLGANAIDVEAPFTGTIVAPSAELRLASLNAPSAHRGAFFARRVLARPGSTIEHLPFGGFPEVVGPDQDGDGSSDPLDNCPAVANPNQLDGDGDERGDVCDLCPEGAQGSARLGPAGGLICADEERVALRVPPGALVSEVLIGIEPSPVNPPLSGLLPGRVYEFSPAGLEFALPALLTIEYADSDVPAGVDESSLIVLSSIHGTALSNDDPWEERPSSVDTAENRVQGTIEHFSHDGIGLPATRVEMSDVTVSLQVGDTHPLTATPIDVQGGVLNHIVEWSTSNAATATVVPSAIVGAQIGTVSATGLGSAFITARVRNSAATVSGTTVVNVTARPRRVVFNGGIFVLDDDFSPIGESDDCGQFTYQDFCEVTASAPTATITLGGPPTCVDDEVMTDATVVCTLDPTTERVTVTVNSRLLESNACPNGDLDGQNSLTVVLDSGQADSRSFRVNNSDEGGDFADWSLAMSNNDTSGPATRSFGGGSVSCP